MVFLWGNRDYLVGNTALMCRRGGERERGRERERQRERDRERERKRERESVLMEVASCL